jgi:DNA-binding beta-propeller fold protein YncE
MMKTLTSRWGLGLVISSALLASACHRGGRTAQHPSGGSNPNAPIAYGSSATTLTSSTVVLGKVGGKRIAFVADSDTKTIRRIDLEAKSELTPLHLTYAPSQLLLLDGTLIVLSRETSSVNRVTGFKGLDHPGFETEWVAAPAEPVSMVLTADRATAYVTSGWGHALAEYDTQHGFKQRRVINLAREPRGIALSDDGSKAFIAHAVGSHLSVVDLKAAMPTPPKLVLMRGSDSRAERTESEANDEDMGLDKKTRARRAAERARRVKEGLPTCQSFALAKSVAVPDRLFVPEVVVDPGEASAEVKSQGYGSSEGEDSEVPIVGVLDGKSGAPVPASLARTEEHAFRPASDSDGLKSMNACLLPRAAVIDDSTKTLLVACQGIDQLVAYDATSAAPARSEVRRWDVGAGPNGIAVDPDSRQAVVWSQFDRTLSIVPLDPGKDGTKDRYRPATRIATGPAAQKSLEQLGRILFHSTHDPRISSDGRACASCHPDGRDDGLVWSTPEGPRRSILLAGRIEDTAPFSWQGNASTVQKHLKSTFDRLGGGGLEGPELDALVKYVKSVGRPPRIEANADDPRVAQGAKIFQSSKAGCYSCHSGAAFTDGAMHNVGSGRSFNTPSLLGTGSGGPWFHDGRYNSLTDLLVKSDGKMGRTKHLKPAELDALETFLRSL